MTDPLAVDADRSFSGIPQLGEAILGERSAEGGELLQALPAAGEQSFFRADEGGIEMLLGEWSVTHDGRKRLVDDELRLGGIAADVALPAVRQVARRNTADDETQVKITVDDLLDLFAAHIAEVALFTPHREPQPVGPNESTLR